MRISDWSSDVCSSDLLNFLGAGEQPAGVLGSLAGLDGDAATEIVGLEMLDIVLRLGVADARLDVLLVAGDQCRQPVFVGEAEQAADAAELDRLAIGRATWRARVRTYVSIPVVAGYLKKKEREKD